MLRVAQAGKEGRDFTRGVVAIGVIVGGLMTLRDTANKLYRYSILCRVFQKRQAVRKFSINGVYGSREPYSPRAKNGGRGTYFIR